jgi:hypothetical protein
MLIKEKLEKEFVICQRLPHIHFRIIQFLFQLFSGRITAPYDKIMPMDTSRDVKYFLINENTTTWKIMMFTHFCVHVWSKLRFKLFITYCKSRARCSLYSAVRQTLYWWRRTRNQSCCPLGTLGMRGQRVWVKLFGFKTTLQVPTSSHPFSFWFLDVLIPSIPFGRPCTFLHHIFIDNFGACYLLTHNNTEMRWSLVHLSRMGICSRYLWT